MSVFSLTKGSEAALSMLTRHAGTETLLLTQPARELRAEITIEPIGTADQRGQIEAVLFMREQRHTMTLQRGDGANAQHLADWVEAAANGTLDTAAAIPQRPSLSLLPCCKCDSEAISYDYAIPGSEFRNGVKCRHHGCQSVEGAETPAEAHAAWNAIQREELDEPAPAQDEREAFEVEIPSIVATFDGLYLIPVATLTSGEHLMTVAQHLRIEKQLRAALARPAQTEQQPTGLSQGWNLVRQSDGFVIGHSSNEPSQQRKEQALADGRVYVPFLVAQTAPQPEQSGLVEALTVARRELHACQAVIHYAGGFDPAYVRDAQSALKQIDAALSAQATRPAA